jgi:hypothetical protein
VASLTAIREGLAANLAGIEGLNESAYLHANPTPPAAEVQPSEIVYDGAFSRGMDTWQLVVRVFVGVTSDRGAQARLDRMLESTGDDSVKAALESDCSLGGACDDLRVTGCSGYRIFSRDGMPPVLGAEWQVQVIATGD